MAINPNMAPRVRPLISCWRKYSIPRELPLPSISPFEPWRRPSVVTDNLTHAIDKPQQLRNRHRRALNIDPTTSQSKFRVIARDGAARRLAARRLIFAAASGCAVFVQPCTDHRRAARSAGVALARFGP